MNELISVIVPIYNAEKYLSRCIESILSQTYSQIEILLIDDGSTDQSAQIMEYYSKVDERVRVFHQSNKGVSEARNMGLNLARGEYIGFVDADDTIEPTMYQELLTILQRTESDVAITKWHTVEDGENRVAIEFEQIEECLSSTTEEVWKKVYFERQGWLLYAIWNKLIVAELAKKFRFEPNVVNGEDIWYSYQILSTASRVVSTSKSLYNYHIYIGSASHGGVVGEKKIQGITVHKRIILDMRAKGYLIADQVYAQYLDSLLREINSTKDDSIYENMLKKVFKQQAIEIVQCKSINTKLKIAYLLRILKL